MLCARTCHILDLLLFQMPRIKIVARKRRCSSSGQEGQSSAQPHYPANLRWEHEAKYDAVKEKKVLKPNVLVN